MTLEKMIEALAVADTELIYNMDDGDQWYAINDLLTEHFKRMSAEEITAAYKNLTEEE